MDENIDESERAKLKCQAATKMVELVYMSTDTVYRGASGYESALCYYLESNIALEAAICLSAALGKDNLVCTLLNEWNKLECVDFCWLEMATINLWEPKDAKTRTFGTIDHALLSSC